MVEVFIQVPERKEKTMHLQRKQIGVPAKTTPVSIQTPTRKQKGTDMYHHRQQNSVAVIESNRIRTNISTETESIRNSQYSFFSAQ